MRQFLKDPLLVLQLPYYTLMTFLMMLFVIMVSVLTMLMIQLATVSVGDRASDMWQQLDRLLNLNLTYETLKTGTGRALLILMLKKLNFFHFTGLITLVLLMWKCWVCSQRKIIGARA